MSTESSDNKTAADEMPADEDLQEPSTAKEPGEEPKADTPSQPEPSHQAVGIGVVGAPLVDPEEPADDVNPEEPVDDEG
ncbi:MULTISPECIES: hypothetical protein [Microbacterium]|uniref:Sugar ABC transporter ATPase n=1 Tax=Microbacterium marmarense TaxID=3122051 RepID=A0ABU8LSD7_9MICO